MKINIRRLLASIDLATPEDTLSGEFDVRILSVDEYGRLSSCDRFQ